MLADLTPEIMNAIVILLFNLGESRVHINTNTILKKRYRRRWLHLHCFYFCFVRIFPETILFLFSIQQLTKQANNSWIIGSQSWIIIPNSLSIQLIDSPSHLILINLLHQIMHIQSCSTTTHCYISNYLTCCFII